MYVYTSEKESKKKNSWLTNSEGFWLSLSYHTTMANRMYDENKPIKSHWLIQIDFRKIRSVQEINVLKFQIPYKLNILLSR